MTLTETQKGSFNAQRTQLNLPSKLVLCRQVALAKHSNVRSSMDTSYLSLKVNYKNDAQAEGVWPGAKVGCGHSLSLPCHHLRGD